MPFLHSLWQRGRRGQLEIEGSTAMNVEVDGTERVGGLVGFNTWEITGSMATGDVRGENYVGGLAEASYEEVRESTASGDVRGETLVGGCSA